MDIKKETDFRRELKELLNRYSRENESNTPDFILAHFLWHVLAAFNRGVNSRESWYGRGEQPLNKESADNGQETREL